MNLNQYLKMFLDNVGICNLDLDAFIVSNITNADRIPLKVGKIKDENADRNKKLHEYSPLLFSFSKMLLSRMMN